MAPAPPRTAQPISRTTPPSACCATSVATHSSRDTPLDTHALRGCYNDAADMIDSHVHLDAKQYPDPSACIKRARDAGVTAIVVPGVGPDSNRKVIDLARQ